MLGNVDCDRIILGYLPIDILEDISRNTYVKKICNDYFWECKLRRDFPLRSKYMQGNAKSNYKKIIKRRFGQVRFQTPTSHRSMKRFADKKGFLCGGIVISDKRYIYDGLNFIEFVNGKIPKEFINNPEFPHNFYLIYDRYGA
jgi:hypothetical protein